MLYEGEYLYCKRNGKGKEYNSYGDVVFEGEFLNGKGKEYGSTGVVRFEGEYLNGKSMEKEKNMIFMVM